MSRKIAVVVTARPSYSRIKTALQAINEHPSLDLYLVLIGWAARSMPEVVEADGFDAVIGEMPTVPPDTPEGMVTLAVSVAHSLAYLFVSIKPDAVITIADRYETLGTAMAASYCNYPLVHVQGGEVTGSIDNKVRNAITQLSDYHFTSTYQARNRLIDMGVSYRKVFHTGCPSIDLAAEVAVRYRNGRVVVMQHPVTTEYGYAEHQIVETIDAVKDLPNDVMWFGSNLDAGGGVIGERIKDLQQHFQRPEEFLATLAGSSCLVGNSSVGLRECSYLGLPVVNIGSRQDGRERADNVVDVPYDRDMIAEAIQSQISVGRYPSSNLYGDGKAGENIAGLLAELPL